MYAMNRTIVSFIVTICWAAPASGDVVAPSPQSCPPGSTATSDHYGGYCTASACATHKDCPGRERCQPYAVCVGKQVFHHPRGNTHRAVARGTCGKARPCQGAAACEVARRCVPEGTTPADLPPGTYPAPGSAARGGCASCDVGPAQLGEGWPGAAGLALLTLLVLGRRRA